MAKALLHVPSEVYQQLNDDLPEVQELLSQSFDVVEWSDATPSSARAAAVAAEEAMKGLETSTAIDCPFMPYVLVGEVAESLTAAAPAYGSPLHMVSATAYGDLEDYFPGQADRIQKALSILSDFGAPSPMSVDGGGMGEVRMASFRAKDGVSCGLLTILLE